MARIALSQGGYKLVSEGTHTFTVKEVKYEEDFGKVQLRMETEKGEKHTEFFTFTDNDKALFAFTMTAKVLMQDNNITDIDPDDLVGKSMIATVEHETSASGKTYAKLTDKKSVEEVSNINSSDDDLDDLFADL